MADYVFELDGKEGAAVAAFLRLDAAQKKLELGSRRVGLASAKAARTQKNWVRDGVKGMASYAAGLTGAVTLAMKLAAAIREAAAEDKKFRQQRLGRLRESEMSLRRLGQIAEGPADLRRQIAASQGMATGAGMPLTDAANLQFNLRSLRKEHQRALFLSVRELGEEPAAMAMHVRTYQRAFGAGAGPSRTVINKLLAGARESKVDIGQIAQAVLKPAKLAGQRGVSDAEVVATIAALGEGLESVDVAGTQVSALLTAAMKKRLPGRSLDEIVRNLEARKLPEHRLTRLLGRKEAVNAYVGIRAERANIARIQAGIEGAGGEAAGADRLARALRDVRSAQKLLEALRLRQSERMGELAGAGEEARLEAAINNIAAELRGPEAGIGGRFLEQRFRAWAEDPLLQLGAGLFSRHTPLGQQIGRLVARQRQSQRGVHVEGGP